MFAQIADFGFSKNIPSAPLTASSVGSPLYSSPEIIQGKPYKGPECDVWSLGVILYVMLTATMPFDDSNIAQFLVKVENGDYPEPCGVSDAAKDLIGRMLEPNPSARITISEILSHPWMTGLSKKVSPLTSKKQRRQAVCYENVTYIHKALEDLNQCNCSCHRSSSPSPFMSRHCEDCEEVTANNPEIMQRRAYRLSRNSSISSGYGSEMGSQYLQTPSPRGSQANIVGLHLLSPVDARRHSMPRKSSAGTIGSNSTITCKISHQRCSVPAKSPVVLSEDSASEEEDDDVVFV